MRAPKSLVPGAYTIKGGYHTGPLAGEVEAQQQIEYAGPAGE